jgi:hypothetical protein
VSFVDYSKTIAGQQQSVLQFLNLPFTAYSCFVNEHADAIKYARSASTFNSTQHTAIDRNLFAIGPIIFIRSPDKNDFRLPSPAASGTEDEYVRLPSLSILFLPYLH